MKITDYHAKYYSYELTKSITANSLEKLTSTLSNAQVDMNPHQIEAALFAFKSPLSKGAILADEVGLGKTIEAGLVISQKWAERKRKMLLIVPANLRKQWSGELQEKFFIPSIILETKSFNNIIKEGNLNPFDQHDGIVICSYNFARNKSAYLKQTNWDLVIIDEAHRLRNVYKSSNKIAKEIKQSLENIPKVLLTATPLQNSLLELYGLVSIIDDHVFGSIESFKAKYSRVSKEQDIFENELGLVEPKQEMFLELRERLKPICIRTLRKQVLEYIRFTKRIPLTQDYIPTEDEIDLYNNMSEYLRTPELYALPSSQRHLMSLILRKLLASSSFAIASTLSNLIFKLEKLIEDTQHSEILDENEISIISKEYESYNDLTEEWVDSEEEFEEESNQKGTTKYTKEDIEKMKAERDVLIHCKNIANKIWDNSKGEALIIALEKGFQMAEELGSDKKAIIFTESRITQDYLYKLLSDNGYENKIVLFNGTNNDDKSKDIYKTWLEKNKDTDKISDSKSADMRASIVDYFKNEAEIMIATEAGAEGINLQFCSLIINYDLPWNPQRIEQRIGRCHRYGQKHDVVVINFVNRKNAADQRVYELLAEKFSLFKGVFGASDEILGNIESGVDFEKRISSIYQNCRTEDEINEAFDELQNEMDTTIRENLGDARQKLLENFDAEVHEKLKMNLHESQRYLDRYERWLWELTKHYLNKNAEFSEHEYSFTLVNNPFEGDKIPEGPYKIGKNIEDSHIYRPGHPLALRILDEVKRLKLSMNEVLFDYSNNETLVTVLNEFIGKEGVLNISNYRTHSFENEDNLILTALDSNFNVIDPEIVEKLFTLSATAKSCDDIEPNLSEKLKESAKLNIESVSNQIAQRNSEYFDNEVEKLDKWAEDMKRALELDLKRLDIEIKTEKTNAKKILNLEEKLEAQRNIKEMEKKRNEMRKRLFEAQDDVDDRKERLLQDIEKKLIQQSTVEELFTIRWKVV